jgi:soluble lytic murein transglycosylase-like protein
MKNYSYTIITFFLAFLLSIFIPYFQRNKEVYNSEVNQSKSVLETDKSIPETKDQSNVLFLKTYLKTYYRKVPDEMENAIAKAIYDLSHKHHVDFNLIVGIIGVESSFNPYATSKIGARGLMQVRYGVWKRHLKIPNIMILHNIHEGIEYGILAFLQCRKEAKGNLKLALQKYNGAKGSKYINKVNKEISRFIASKKGD